MKAILTYTVMLDDKKIEHTRLFDTNKAKKICDVKNDFGNAVQEIYITPKGIIFLHNIFRKNLEVVDQEYIKKWIGENEPDKYIKFLGEVEEA